MKLFKMFGTLGSIIMDIAYALCVLWAVVELYNWLEPGQVGTTLLIMFCINGLIKMLSMLIIDVSMYH